MLWLFTWLSLASAAVTPAPTPSKDARMDKFISRLMAKMTLDEKAGQLNQYSADMAITGSTLSPQYLKAVEAGQVGSVFNAFGPQATRDIQKVAVEKSRLKIPLLFGHDVIHGHRTIFPIPLGEAASWDLPRIERSARLAALEASADGIHWAFAPMVDIARDPRWGRVSEGAGEDVWLGSKVAAARVRGLQGKGSGATDSVLACVKHFAAYGAPVGGRDYNVVDMSERELFETYLPPYEAAVKAGARTVMTAFNEINGVPATSNTWLLKDLLRGKWKFDGLVVTDYTAVNELMAHGVAADEKEAARLAFNAGSEMDMMSSAYLKHLPELVRKGQVRQSDVDRAVRRVLETKYRLGLFEDPYRFSDVERAKANIMSKEILQHARDISRRSIVLLKNKGGVLPLKKSGTIALIGPMVENKRDQIGNWSSAGDWKQSVSLAEGMREVAGAKGAKLLLAKGTNLIEDASLRTFLNKHGGEIEMSPRPAEDLLNEAVKTAKKADVVVLALGETQGMSGEAASRTNIRLPENQQALLKAVKATGKPIVLVLFNGRPLALEMENEMVDAIVETWFLGTQAGLAIADTLFGDYNPSGKLPITFPRNEGQIPIYYGSKNTGRPFDAKEKYRTKYLDAGNDPLFPFGHGLSYTKFEISEPQLSSKEIAPNGKLNVKVAIKNVGERAGTETVQLYVRDMVSSVTRPMKQLRGFAKVELKPQESRDVEFTLAAADLEFYDLKMKKVVEPGEFKVMVGPDSANLKEASFTVSRSGRKLP